MEGAVGKSFMANVQTSSNATQSCVTIHTPCTISRINVLRCITQRLRVRILETKWSCLCLCLFFSIEMMKQKRKGSPRQGDFPCKKARPGERSWRGQSPTYQRPAPFHLLYWWLGGRQMQSTYSFNFYSQFQCFYWHGGVTSVAKISTWDTVCLRTRNVGYLFPMTSYFWNNVDCF